MNDKIDLNFACSLFSFCYLLVLLLHLLILFPSNCLFSRIRNKLLSPTSSSSSCNYFHRQENFFAFLFLCRYSLNGEIERFFACVSGLNCFNFIRHSILLFHPLKSHWIVKNRQTRENRKWKWIKIGNERRKKKTHEKQISISTSCLGSLKKLACEWMCGLECSINFNAF